MSNTTFTADTGWKVPTTAAINTGASSVVKNWKGTPFTVAAFQVEDGVSLSAILGNTSAAGASTNSIVAGGFGFDVPANANITNIEIRYRVKIDGPHPSSGTFGWRMLLVSGVVAASHSIYGDPIHLTAAQGYDATLSSYAYITAQPSVNYTSVTAVVNTTAFGTLFAAESITGPLIFPTSTFTDLDVVEMRVTYTHPYGYGKTPRIRTTKPLLVKHYFATGM